MDCVIWAGPCRGRGTRSGDASSCYHGLSRWSRCLGCEYFGNSKANTAPPAPPPPVVQVIEASPRDVMVQSEWVAQTYSQDAVDVRARVNGYIEERRFNAGNLVKQGDILYKLDDRPYQAQVDRAKGDLGQKQADLQFAKEQVQVLEAQAQLPRALGPTVAAPVPWRSRQLPPGPRRGDAPVRRPTPTRRSEARRADRDRAALPGARRWVVAGCGNERCDGPLMARQEAIDTFIRTYDYPALFGAIVVDQVVPPMAPACRP